MSESSFPVPPKRGNRSTTLLLAIGFVSALLLNGGGEALSGVLPQDVAPAESTKSNPNISADAQEHERATEESQQEEHHRIFGVLPSFNMTNDHDAAPLSSGQKFHLAFRTAFDPFEFVLAGLDAGYSQAVNDFRGYGQGAQGYGKRVGAAYADQLSAAVLGNAVFTSLLHEDPRYYRAGNGSIPHRMLHSIASAVWTRNDNGSWGPNYSNVLGNITAGGLANLYYPRTDRGLELTFQRALTVTAENSFGAFLMEFWPDIDRKLFHRRQQKP